MAKRTGFVLGGKGASGCQTGQALRLFLLFLVLGVWGFQASAALGAPLEIHDALGRAVTIQTPPARVVSLVPAVTEELLAIGAGDRLAGMTYHDETLPGVQGKAIVGGFAAPSVEKIAALKPDLIIVGGLHKAVKARFKTGRVILLQLDAGSVAQLYDNIRLLGRIFGREAQAASVVSGMKRQFDLIARKSARIPQEKRLRVMRLMGTDPLATPGDDSFQDDFIRSAGGIPPQFGRKGPIIKISLAEWQRFNPQAVYACGDNHDAVRRDLDRPGWRDVDAVKNNRIYFFPCNLTCRASVHAGDFVEALWASLYGEAFGGPGDQVLPDRIVSGRDVTLDLPYVRKAQVVTSTLHDFVNKTLVVDFAAPMTVVSTLEGQKAKVTTVANHYLPPPTWRLAGDLQGLRDDLARLLGRNEATSSFLFTGADMDNLSVQRQSFRDMTVYALVTAGVRMNALRASRDAGGYYEPGTINIILLTNMRLTPRAMTRAIVTATEAKSAALADLDIRSSYTPRQFQATGTGTDNVVVAEGAGQKIDNAGGHTKMGELIAKAVYAGVKEAIQRQNGLVAGRTVIERLSERRIHLFGLVNAAAKRCQAPSGNLTEAMEGLLLTPRYAGYVEASLAASDDLEAGTLADPEALALWGRAVAGEIAGRPFSELRPCVTGDGLPEPLAEALNALVNGAIAKQEAEAR